ncbi:MAG: tetratricopeptide repeat protein [Saprospiraceae bacterium]|nr:tetratricopeptide repeat protein [Saprospiraceae bacterium]
MSYKAIAFNLILSIFITPSVWTQSTLAPEPPKNYKQLIRLAEKYVEQGHISDAAPLLETAYQLKPQKTEVAYQAALLYLKSREYRKAINLFRPLVNEKKYPDIHFEFAQALQQAGEWDEAIPEYLIYLNQYTGNDREQVTEKIEDFIAGCSLAIRQSDSTKTSNIIVGHLNENINTQENDIAPVPFGDDVLYFTTRWNDVAKILRSQQVGSDWMQAEPLKSLNVPTANSIGNGTFAPDGSRFYCTMCQETAKKKKKSCGIYYLKRTKDGWTAPIRLSERINYTGTNEDGMTTHPYVIHKGNSEILFFVSNRKGGKGGMDIWLSARSRSNENSEFDSPMNLGSIINTEGDEVTPYYNEDEQTLYFASNGRATMGGLDIFKSQGSGQHWTSPQNMGVPFNSSADDWYFVKNKSQIGGFFVSNRLVGIEKITSKDDDIFSFTVNNRIELLVLGRVFDKQTSSLLENARLSLYEIRATNDDNLRLLSSSVSREGTYQFTVLPQKSYALEAEKDGFQASHKTFSTKDSLKNDMFDFFLERYIPAPALSMEVYGQYPTPTDAKKDGKPKVRSVALKTETIHKETESVKTKKTETVPTGKTKPVKETVQYKIQLFAYESDLDKVNTKKLKKVEDLGDFDTEIAQINGKRYTRILLTYNTYEAALSALQKVKSRSLTDAFIVRYENGKRINKSK